jgi:chemotaxis protein MotB
VYKDNWDLSVARATSMVRLLTDTHNVDPIRVTAAGRGEYDPKSSNSTAEGRAKNRRTEIILSPKLEELMMLIGE